MDGAGSMIYRVTAGALQWAVLDQGYAELSVVGYSGCCWTTFGALQWIVLDHGWYLKTCGAR
jgi:hypothetical protein